LVEIRNGRARRLPDFENLRDQIEDYNPTNTELRECPSLSSTWQVHSNLPPTPNQELCRCMVRSLSCVANEDDIDEDDIGDLFGTVCGMGEEICAGISANATSGAYGAYSMCNPIEQLSHALNQYYQSQNEAADACDFGGAARTQNPTRPSGTCADLMEEAGPDGTGNIDGSSTSSSAATPMTLPAFNFGLLSLAAYVLCAMAAGAGVIFV
jgi:hypothetical protein